MNDEKKRTRAHSEELSHLSNHFNYKTFFSQCVSIWLKTKKGWIGVEKDLQR